MYSPLIFLQHNYNAALFIFGALHSDYSKYQPTLILIVTSAES